MYEAVTERFAGQNIIIKAAAVADYRPKEVAQEKIKKKDGALSVEMERTDDILAYLGAHKRPDQYICGFSMLENSRAKLERKKIDMIAANNLKQDGAGFGTDTNIVTLITKNSEEELPKLSKQDTANRIVDEIIRRMK